MILVLGIAILVLGQPNPTVAYPSQLTGLATLRGLAQTSMPYETAIANGKPTLLEFYADWCPTCQSMAPILNRLHDQYSPRINFVLLNIDQPQWTPQIQQFGVTGVPHLVLLDRHGQRPVVDHRQVSQTLMAKGRSETIGRVPAPVLADLLEQSLQP